LVSAVIAVFNPVAIEVVVAPVGTLYEIDSVPVASEPARKVIPTTSPTVMVPPTVAVVFPTVFVPKVRVSVALAGAGVTDDEYVVRFVELDLRLTTAPAAVEVTPIVERCVSALIAEASPVATVVKAVLSAGTV
jgi:hypothetical protein